MELYIKSTFGTCTEKFNRVFVTSSKALPIDPCQKHNLGENIIHPYFQFLCWPSYFPWPGYLLSRHWNFLVWTLDLNYNAFMVELEQDTGYQEHCCHVRTFIRMTIYTSAFIQIYRTTGKTTLVFLLSHQSTGLAKKACHNSSVDPVPLVAGLPCFLPEKVLVWVSN